MRALSAVTSGALVVAYPLAIWWGLSHFSPRGVSLMAISLLVPALLIRFRGASRKDLLTIARVPLLVMAVLLFAAVFDDERLVLATPVIISAVLLVAFAKTLFTPPSMIETFARLKEKDLSEAKIAHCRQITAVWCAFFVVNGAVAGTLAFAELRDAWALYTGLLAYCVMGFLFVSEYFLRQFRFRDYGTGLHDKFLQKLFPKKSATESPAESDAATP